MMEITVWAGSGSGSEIEEKVSKVMDSRLQVMQLMEERERP